MEWVALEQSSLLLAICDCLKTSSLGLTVRIDSQIQQHQHNGVVPQCDQTNEALVQRIQRVPLLPDVECISAILACPECH